jgi:hypothetical protein
LGTVLPPRVHTPSRWSPLAQAYARYKEKRKSRSFGKKIRYQTRKALAEQRPRVRGQFVRIPKEGEPGSWCCCLPPGDGFLPCVGNSNSSSVH